MPLLPRAVMKKPAVKSNLKAKMAPRPPPKALLAKEAGPCPTSRAKTTRETKMPPKMPPPLHIGTDFSGLDGPVFALQMLNIPHLHIFSCDQDNSVRKFIANNHKPHLLYDKIEDRDHQTTPHVDLYVFGFPCTPFSSLGQESGIHHVDGALVFESLKYIEAKRPRCIVMENVGGILRGNRRNLIHIVIDTLKHYNYDIHCEILDTRDYGLPQSRRRLYVVGIQQQHKVRDFHWPDVVTDPELHVPLKKLVDKASDWKPLPTSNGTHRRNVVTALEKHCSDGKNPFELAICVDMGASAKWATSHMDYSMTLSKSRCEQFGHWVTCKGGPLTLYDYMLLQGYPFGIFNFDGISQRQAAAMIGNAMSFNVLVALLPQVLHSGGLIDWSTYRRTKSTIDDLLMIIHWQSGLHGVA